MSKYIIGIDQSTQGTKALLVDEGGHLIHRADRSHRQIVNEAGWVSHDPAEIAANVLAVARAVVEETGVDPVDVAGIGISNQRETTVAWNRTTGEPLCDAVVWQCARARELCDELAAREGVAELVRDTTGLVLSPYYPAGKMAWILANVPAAAEAAAAGELCLGTIDAWVVWTLTGGAEFRCDWSNASRTQLFDLRRGCWSEPVCEAFGVNPACLPQVTDSDGLFGTTDLRGFLPAPVPIHGVLGDSHAALFAQGCHSRGMAKATYGTGSSVMMNVGDEFVASSHGLSSSLAWRMDGVTEYVLEGNVSYAGAVKTWLRDDLELINNPEEVTDLCYAANPASRVYFVPAFTGLGAPYWDMYARGCIVGLTRGTKREHIIRAAQESIAYQVADLAESMEKDTGLPLSHLKADGGASRDRFLMQFQADILNRPVRRPVIRETTALGAAFLAGLAVGVWSDREAIKALWVCDQEFTPQMTDAQRQALLRDWHRAVGRSRGWAEE